MAEAHQVAPVLPSSCNPRLAGALIIVAAVLAYANSFTVPFVFDDEYSIAANPTIQSLVTAWSPPRGNGITVSGRPVLNFSFALNYAISGGSVWSYHVLNLVIHLAAALTLYGLVRTTLALARGRDGANGRTWREKNLMPVDSVEVIAMVVALLWALHPLQTESVTYTVQRAESLAALFVLLTLRLFTRAVQGPGSRTRRRAWLFSSILCSFLGGLTKESAVVAPILVLLYDRIFVADSWRDLARRWAYYLALFATWIPVAASVIADNGRGGTFTFTLDAFGRYALTQPIALIRYLSLAIWPAPLVIDYGTFAVEHARLVLPELVIVVLLVGGVVWALARRPAIGFVGACFFLTLAPASLAPGTIQMIVEHRMYLPLAAVLTGAAVALHALFGRRGCIAVAASVAVGFGLTTAARNVDYATPVRLFQDTVAKRPTNARAMALLADYHRRAGNRAEACRWLEQSLAADPSPAAVWNNLGDAWQELGRPEKAIPCFEQALARRPHDVSIETNLANALILAGHSTAGLGRLESILRQHPQFARARANYASGLAISGRMSEAAEQFATLVQQGFGILAADAPARDPQVRLAYAEVLAALHRSNEAIEQLQAAIQLQPALSETHTRLGILLGRAGRLREAEKEFEIAIRLDAANDTARQNLEIARRRLGHP